MALLTLFEVSTFDNWSNILQIAVNSHLSNHVNIYYKTKKLYLIIIGTKTI